MKITRVEHKWAGLRTFAPDKSLVAGPNNATQLPEQERQAPTDKQEDTIMSPMDSNRAHLSDNDILDRVPRDIVSAAEKSDCYLIESDGTS